DRVADGAGRRISPSRAGFARASRLVGERTDLVEANPLWTDASAAAPETPVDASPVRSGARPPSNAFARRAVLGPVSRQAFLWPTWYGPGGEGDETPDKPD